MADNPNGFWKPGSPGLDIGDIVDIVGKVVDLPFVEIAPLLQEAGVTSQNGTATNGTALGPVRTPGGCGQPVTAAFTTKTINKAPRGYVMVDTTGDGRSDTAMLKAHARHCGYWRPAAKPPISAKNWKALRRANTAARQVKRVATVTNKITHSIFPRRASAKKGRR